MFRAVVTLVAIVVAPPILAQEGARFRANERTSNAGGAPAGATVSSARFRLQPAAIGQGVGHHALVGANYRSSLGFVSAYPPPGEVRGLVLAADRTTLTWDAEPSVGRYHVYRDGLSALPGLGFGACLDGEVPGTTLIDPGVPGDGTGYFYLVTAVNRLDQEGTKGITSGGTERGNPAPCP